MKLPEYKRKLTAILSADVVGYSRLMGENEVSTIRTLKRYKEVIGKLVQNYRGRVVDAPGDNLLAEFVSVVDAVQCAVEIQREISESNEEQSQKCKMKFRIGVNLGDVVEEEDRIYGDGVNIAARVEGLAEAGGICVTGAAYEQVKNKIEANFEYMGQQKVKNITDPIEVYRIGKITYDAPTAFNELPPLSKNPELPEKPSVVVLPFENLTGDSSQEFIGDGITESINVALSKLDELFVIARNSAFAYKNKQVPVEQIGQELGVRFILGGSVLKASQRIRITARLVDVTTGHHLWTEQFDREMADFFSLLDEVAQKTTVSLQVELTQGAQVLRTLDTRNFEAWGCYIKAANFFMRFTHYDNVKARELLYKAVEADPGFALAWLLLAWTFFVEVRFGFTKDPVESIGKAIEFGTKAKELDEVSPDTHSFWNTVYLVQGDFEKAIEKGQKAVELGPNNALAYILLCQTMRFAGRFQEAINFGKIAIRLCPRCPSWYLAVLAPAYIEAGKLEQGVSILKEGLERCRKGEIPASHVLPHLAVAYVRLGQRDRASDCARKLMESEPLFSLSSNSEQLFYKDPKLKEAYLRDMKAAGLS